VIDRCSLISNNVLFFLRKIHYCVFLARLCPDPEKQLELVQPPYRNILHTASQTYFKQIDDVCCSAEYMIQEFEKIRVLIAFDGTVHWEPGGVFIRHIGPANSIHRQYATRTNSSVHAVVQPGGVFLVFTEASLSYKKHHFFVSWRREIHWCPV